MIRKWFTKNVRTRGCHHEWKRGTMAFWLWILASWVIALGFWVGGGITMGITWGLISSGLGLIMVAIYFAGGLDE